MAGSAIYIDPKLLHDSRVFTYRARTDQPTAAPSIPLAANFIKNYHGGVGYARDSHQPLVQPWAAHGKQEQIHEMLADTEQLRGDAYNFKKRPNLPVYPNTPLSGGGAPSFPTATPLGARKIRNLLQERTQQYNALQQQLPLPAPSPPELNDTQAEKFKFDLSLRAALDKIDFGNVDKTLYSDIQSVISLFFQIAPSLTDTQIADFETNMEQIEETADDIIQTTRNEKEERLARQIKTLAYTAHHIAAEYGFRSQGQPIETKKSIIDSLRKKIRFNARGKTEDNNKFPDNVVVKVSQNFLNRRAKLTNHQRELLINAGYTNDEINRMSAVDIKQAIRAAINGQPRILVRL